MKRGLLTAAILAFGINAFSQNLFFNFHKTKAHSIKQETVMTANKMSDLIPFYPSDWVSDYVSVELIYIKDGVSKTFVGKDELITPEQKSIVKTAMIGDDITINIKYKTKNAVNGKNEVSTMHYETSVTPEIEAQFETNTKTNAKHDESDGRTAQYVKENIINKIPEATKKEIKETSIRFTVNEEGAVIVPKVYKSCGDKKIDALVLDAISKMPKWMPAKDAKGNHVKQNFEFTFGVPQGC